MADALAALACSAEITLLRAKIAADAGRVGFATNDRRDNDLRRRELGQALSHGDAMN
jgi:hypothetical protein